MNLILAWLSSAVIFLSMVLTTRAEAGAQPGRVIAWGKFYDGTNFSPVWVPAGLTNAVAIVGGAGHSVALLPNGTLTAWGYNYYGQTNVPPGLDEVIGITAGQYFSLALRADGTVVGWGEYYDGADFVPISVPSVLTNVIEVAAGAGHGLALQGDGTVIAWGDDSFGQADVPLGLSNVVAIAGGERSSFALLGDGTVVSWGQYFNGSIFVPSFVPAGLTNVTDISSGAGHSVALLEGGSVLAWGFAPYGQTNVPPGLTNVVSISAGENHSLALRTNATVIAWGSNLNGQTNVPANATNVVQVAAGYYHGLAIAAEGPVVWSNAVIVASLPVGGSTNLSISVASQGPFSVQWFLNGAPIAGATSANLAITNFDFSQAGSYAASVRNQGGSVLRKIAVLYLTNSPVVLIDGIDTGGGTILRVDSAEVSMSSTFGTNAGIYYTLDGTAPDFTSIPYSGPFDLTNSATLRVIAYNATYSAWAESIPLIVQIWPTYPLEADTPGGGTVSALPLPYTDNRYLSNSLVTLTATPLDGWSFMGWNGVSTVSNVTTVLMNEPQQIQAVFGTALNLFTNGQGQIIAEPAVGPYAFGSTVQLTALPAPGYYFFGWAGAVSGNANPITIQATNAAGITALFGELKTNQVALTVLESGDGEVIISPPGPIFTNGDLVMLQAFPGTNSVFAGWGGDASGYQNPLMVQLESSEVITASFVTQSVSNPPVIVDQPLSTTVSLGSATTLSAQAMGDPPITYQWRLNGSPVPGGTDAALFLPNVGAIEAGRYDVVISNPGGVVTSSGALVAAFACALVPSANGPVPLLMLDGAPGSAYRIEVSEDLSSSTWDLLTSVTLQQSRYYYIDELAATHLRRFYRAVPQ
jgi:hypothetical protein